MAHLAKWFQNWFPQACKRGGLPSYGFRALGSCAIVKEIVLYVCVVMLYVLRRWRGGLRAVIDDDGCAAQGDGQTWKQGAAQGEG